MGLHGLETLHHRLVILHAMLNVDGDAVEAALRHHLGGKARWDREPGIDRRFALGPDLFDFIRHGSRFPVLAALVDGGSALVDLRGLG